MTHSIIIHVVYLLILQSLLLIECSLSFAPPTRAFAKLEKREINPFHTESNDNELSINRSRRLLSQSKNKSDDEIITTSSNSSSTSLTELCTYLNASPVDLLRFGGNSSTNERGIYLNHPIKKDDILLKLPLSSCIRDDKPPIWYDTYKTLYRNDFDSDNLHYNPNKWATRLAATILDLQIRFEHYDDDNDEIVEENGDDENSKQKGRMIMKGWKKWLAMMPDKDCLRASLPIHWSEDIISQSKCTALELNIDASYFARAEAISDLVSAMNVDDPDGTLWGKEGGSGGIDITKYEDNMEEIANNIFDIVQTRSCRAERIDGSMQIIRPSLRILAPIFDFINHGSCRHEGIGSANAYFGLEGGNDDDGDGSGEEEKDDLFLVVRARRDIETTEEVLFDYGDSARPAWRCLASYGFVPEYRKDEEDDNESVAEVYMDGARYEVTSHTVPYGMVEAASASYLEEIKGPSALMDDDKVENEYENETILTPDLALRIAKRVSDAAFQLLIDPRKEDERRNYKGETYDDSSESSNEIARKLASSLRWSQHQVLLACALGLRDYAGSDQK